MPGLGIVYTQTEIIVVCICFKKEAFKEPSADVYVLLTCVSYQEETVLTRMTHV